MNTLYVLSPSLLHIHTTYILHLGDDITFFGFGDIASYRKGSAPLYTLSRSLGPSFSPIYTPNILYLI